VIRIAHKIVFRKPEEAIWETGLKQKIIFIQVLKKYHEKTDVGASLSVAASCDHSTGPSGFTRDGEFID
jgi:hypothetical protein